MKAIILCGYRRDSERALGVDGEPPRIEKVLGQVSALGLDPVIVLAGEQADEQLRACPRIDGGELVFDLSESPNLASNLKAGLAAAEGESCFVFPVEVPLPPPDHWKSLSQELWRAGFHAEESALQAVDPSGAPCHYGFPLLITRSGNALIRKLSNFLSLTDPRLQYRHLVFQTESALAEEQNPL